MGKQWKQCQTLFFGAPKSLQMVTAAMKLKDAYSLEEKLWLTCALLFETPAFKRRVPCPHVALSIGWNLNKPWPDVKVLEDKSITRWQDGRIWIPELPGGTELLPTRCVLVTQSCPTLFQPHGLHIEKQRHYLPTKVCLVKAMFFSSSHVWHESWTIKKDEHWWIDTFELDIGENSWEFLGLQGDPTNPS